MIPKKIQNSIWFNGLLLAIAVILSISAYRAVRQATQFSGETEENRKQIKELLGRKEKLEAKLTELQTPEAKERSAKERLNLKKIGEEVVVVLPEENKGEFATQEKSLWNKVGNFFIKLIAND